MMQVLLLLAFSLSSFATSDMKCEATYDKLGIPHQKVADVDQYYFCFGFHHAKDRGWEMDYFRRVGQGRNAEIYGFSSLKSDMMMRLLDLPTFAEKLYTGLPDFQKHLLIKYSEGVNQGFLEGKNAKEFLDKGYETEVWEPTHSILVLLLQSFDQTRKTFLRDWDEEKWGEVWKEKAPALFDEDGLPWLNTIVKEGEYPKREIQKTTFHQLSRKDLKLWGQFPTVFGEESGSNNWVVSKEKSKEGFAMLANDPHLDLKTPLFWYWIHLESPTDKVIGASVPGAPFVVSGTNGHVAWGLTNAYIKTADAVFLSDATEDQFESFRPTVKVKFGPFKLPIFFKKFEKTKEGFPVLPLEIEKDERMVLKWSGFFMKSMDLVPMFDLMKTKTVSDMDKILQGVGLPAWNFVFADTKGEIGYRVVGKPFKNLNQVPFAISTITTTELKNPEFLDPMERPYVLKPKRNYIYTANNRHWPTDAKFNGGRGYSFSFRGFRIDELLKEGKHDWRDFSRIQCDRQAVDARFFVPLIQKHLSIPELAEWKFDTDPSSKAVGIYRRFMDLLMAKWKINENALYRLLSDVTPDRKQDMEQILKQARKEVKDRTWNDLHRLSFSHLSKNGDWVFSPEIPGPGDNHSVDPGTSKWDDDRNLYDHFSGASMRMIIEMKNKPVIHLSLPGHNRDYQTAQAFIPWESWSKCEFSEVSMEL